MTTASLLRRARTSAGLSLRELARRAGTSAPTLSAYESGAKSPRAEVLARVLRAAGFELTIRPSVLSSHRFADMMCQVLADRVLEDPSLVDRARTVLDGRESSTYTDAWRSLLDAGPDAVVAVLTSDRPSARGLKSDNPFAELGVVDEPTRSRLLEAAHAG